MASLLYVFIWSDLVPTSPWGKLHPVSTAVLIVTVLSTRTHSVLKTHSSFHSCFPWLYVNCFQSPWFQCIVIESSIFPWWVSREGGGGGGMHVSKERGDEKRKVGWNTFPHYVTQICFYMRGFAWFGANCTIWNLKKEKNTHYWK